MHYQSHQVKIFTNRPNKNALSNAKRCVVVCFTLVTEKSDSVLHFKHILRYSHAKTFGNENMVSNSAYVQEHCL